MLDFFEVHGFVVNAFLPTHNHFPRLVEVDCIWVKRSVAQGVS
jgi:hypothetical protein